MRVESREIKLGAQVDGKTVADIVWTVHVANKKASWYEKSGALGIDAYKEGATPPLRNRREGQQIDDQNRLRKLIIDPGPRAVRGSDDAPVNIDCRTRASFAFDGGIKLLPDYPKSFPADLFPTLVCPHGPLDTLGDLRTDSCSRLVAAGGYGRTAAWSINGRSTAPLEHDTNDGPVTATLIFTDGSHQGVQGNAWLVATDPGYAPQVLNSVSLWDDIFDSWVRHLALKPTLFREGAFQEDYKPS